LKKRRKKASRILQELSTVFRAQFFTSDETEGMRSQAIKQLDQAIEELWRGRRKFETMARTRIYLAIGSLARVREAILTNHELSEIHEILEQHWEEVKQIEQESKRGEIIRK
jgi:hypothetical protein